MSHEFSWNGGFLHTKILLIKNAFHFSQVSFLSIKKKLKKKNISKGFEKNVADNWLETAYIKITF